MAQKISVVHSMNGTKPGTLPMIIERLNMQKKYNPLSKKACGDLARVKRRYGRLGRLWRHEDYRRDLLKVYRANARDLYRSMKLAVVLASLRNADPIVFPIANDMVGDKWVPFRVERGLTGSMRGEIRGDRFTGTLTSNMLDSSSVIFLQNTAGDTMRTLVPSPATSAEMLAQSLERWRKNAGYKVDHYADYWDRHQDTHVSGVIHDFARSDQWTNGLTHPEIIDAIDASCKKPEDVRPVIRVYGGLIQKGVALATVIEINGEQRTFVPTGFFKALTKAVQNAVPHANEPRLIAA